MLIDAGGLGLLSLALAAIRCRPSEVAFADRGGCLQHDIFSQVIPRPIVYALLRQNLSSPTPSDGVRKLPRELPMRAVFFLFPPR